MKPSPEIPLRQFKQWMQQMLLDPFLQTEINPVELLPEKLKNSAGSVTGIDQVIEDSQKLKAERHLDIYQRSYIARLRNCMSQQFSALEFALGENIFIAFADDYLASRPSTHYNLSELGKDFANYLQSNRPDAEEDEKEDWIDFMIELAQFEYHFSLLYDQKGDEHFKAANIEDQESNMELREVCDVFSFQFPIRWFYSEFKHDREPGLPQAYPTYCLIVRHDYQLSLYDLSQEQFNFLSLMKQGNTFEQAKLLFTSPPNQKSRNIRTPLQQWKEQWLEINLLRKIEPTFTIH